MSNKEGYTTQDFFNTLYVSEKDNKSKFRQSKINFQIKQKMDYLKNRAMHHVIEL